MCIDKRWIVNRYTNTPLFVPCGHCEACQQEKASKRSARIRNEYNLGNVCLFVTLTYDRHGCPYILKSEYNRFRKNPVRYPLNIYRDYSVRRKRVGKGSSYQYESIRTPIKHVVSTFTANDIPADKSKSYWNIPQLGNVKKLKFTNHHIGVCYYPDVQKFVQRVRINLKRDYKLNGDKIRFFACSEYGPRSFRPHFHLLIFTPYDCEASLRNSIVKSWPYSSEVFIRERCIEVAKDCAGYVSSYVNCGTNFPASLKTLFNQKHSYSKGFGCSRVSFQLPKILEKADRGTMLYDCERKVAGVLSKVPSVVPKYVINRFFPLFKGLRVVAPNEVANLVTTLSSVSFGETDIITITSYNEWCRNGKITYENLYRIVTRLHNAYLYYYSVTGRSCKDFGLDYSRVWNCWKSTSLKFYHENTTDAILERYDNIGEFLTVNGNNLLLSDHDGQKLEFIEVDPNKFLSNLNNHAKLLQTYHSYLKHMIVTDELVLNSDLVVDNQNFDSLVLTL